MSTTVLPPSSHESSPPGSLSGVRSSGRCDLLRAAIAQYGGVIDWTVDSSGWLVMLYLPEERAFYGGTLEGALAACHSWLLMSYRETRLAWD